MSRTIEVMPSASRLTSSLRDIGYEFVTAVADIVDNSVSAGASEVAISIDFNGAASSVTVADDGVGMPPRILNEALRFGSRRSYAGDDLGKFGLGLKTASLSQCRKVSVISRAAGHNRRMHARVLDLDHVERTDNWEVLAPPIRAVGATAEPLLGGSGTVVRWDQLDRVLTYSDPDSAWARRKLDQLSADSAGYLGMVFHRFIAGEVENRAPLKITVNDEVVQAWDPFARDEPAQLSLRQREYRLATTSGVGVVRMTPFVLPPRDRFTSQGAFELLGGPLKWNRQQGLYVYRADRLIQHGGWCGLRTLDEHTKLARVALDFDPDLDELFQVNVAKMRVGLPGELRVQLEPAISEACKKAGAVYREANREVNTGTARTSESVPRSEVAQSMRSSALLLGDEEWHALERIVEHLRLTDPELVDSLGF